MRKWQEARGGFWGTDGVLFSDLGGVYIGGCIVLDH